jgi:hypothetical protein
VETLILLYFILSADYSSGGGRMPGETPAVESEGGISREVLLKRKFFG